MKKIVFFSDAIGAAFNCIAIAQECQKYNFKCYFIADHSFKGFFAKYGFEECLVNIHGLDYQKSPSHEWIDYINRHLSTFRLSTFEQIEAYVAPLFDKIISCVINSHSEIKSAVDKIKPDLICIDDVVSSPALTKSSCPWVRIISCNEGEISDPLIPPRFSGYGKHNRKDWKNYSKEFRKCFHPVYKKLNYFLTEHNFPTLPYDILFEVSPYMNFFIFPKAIAYKRRNILDPNNFCYLNGCIRQETPYQLPNFKNNNKDKLIYISHGSMGSGDINFIKNQITALSNQNCRVLVNVGENISSYTNLSENIIISQNLPQPQVISVNGRAIMRHVKVVH
jgi:UDP:flavonoid glycosyltransferase YjiC (YdhE family)